MPRRHAPRARFASPFRSAPPRKVSQWKHEEVNEAEPAWSRLTFACHSERSGESRATETGGTAVGRGGFSRRVSSPRLGRRIAARPAAQEQQGRAGRGGRGGVGGGGQFPGPGGWGYGGKAAGGGRP